MNTSDTFVTPFGTFATGAVPKVPDARDHQLERVPAIAAILQDRLPQRVDRSKLVWRIDNQGSEPSCVAFSTGYCCQGFETAEGKNLDFDAHLAYREVGGDGKNGIPADRLLAKTKKDGFPVLGGPLRYRIDSYQWSKDLTPALAAVASGRLAVMACLLPREFVEISSGASDVAGTPTNSYHQLAITGYEYTDDIQLDGWVYGPNSWGSTFGKAGFYRLRMSYLLSSPQVGFFYSYSLADAPDGDAVPVPTPQPTPVPKPQPVAKITGVGVEVRKWTSVGAVTRGNELVILGTGFGSQRGQLSWGSAFVTVRDWSDTRISALAPAPLMSGARAPLTVKTTDGAVVLGPTLTIR